jgi:translation initiation factor IF-3
MVHQDIGRRILDRVADNAKNFAVVERAPLLEGKNLFMILAPSRQSAPPAAAPAAAQAAPQATTSETTKATATRAAAPKETATSA